MNHGSFNEIGCKSWLEMLFPSWVWTLTKSFSIMDKKGVDIVGKHKETNKTRLVQVKSSMHHAKKFIDNSNGMPIEVYVPTDEGFEQVS